MVRDSRMETSKQSHTTIPSQFSKWFRSAKMISSNFDSEKSDIESSPAGKMGAGAVHDELRRPGGLCAEDVDFLANFTEDQRKKVLRKVDVSCAFVQSPPWDG